MKAELNSLLRQAFLSWNLRNLTDVSTYSNDDQGFIIGARLGEYPIDGWRPHFMEVPVQGKKKDITGRCNHVGGIRMKHPVLNLKRVIYLPVYSKSQELDKYLLGVLVKYWGDLCIPEDIPCMALAIKAKGWYSEDREAQSATILLVWADRATRILSLDWTEGSLEDCITPEWFMEASPLMVLHDSINKMIGLYSKVNWRDARFSLYSIPTCLGSKLCGAVEETSSEIWHKEWSYTDYSLLDSDLKTMLGEIVEIFSEDGGLDR